MKEKWEYKLSDYICNNHFATVQYIEEQYPEFKSKIFDESSIRFVKSPDIEIERTWFEEKFEDIYKDVYCFMTLYYEEDEKLKHAYIVYINYLYLNYKEVPVAFKEFKQWFFDVSFFQSPKIEFDIHADLLGTYQTLDNGERCIFYAYLIKESVENVTALNFPLENQKETINAIENCFKIRENNEVEISNLMFALTGLDLETVLANYFVVLFGPKKCNLLVDTLKWTIHYDDEDSKKLIEKYMAIHKNKEKQDEDEDEAAESLPYLEEVEEVSETVVMLKNFSEHFWIVRKRFLEHDIEPVIWRSDNRGEMIVLHQNVETTIRFKDTKFYRISGEKIYNLDAVIHELIKKQREYETEKQSVDKKAKTHFFNFLKSEQRETFDNLKYAYLPGNNYDYIIHQRRDYNNILRIPKNNKEVIRSMCITPKDPHISEYDVLATVTLLVQSGREDILNDTGNLFPLNEDDMKLLDELSISIAKNTTSSKLR